MTHEESAELAEPGVGSFDDPAAFVASELSAVLVAPVLAVLAIRDDEVDTALCEPLAQRIGVVGAVRDYAFGLLPRTAFGARDFDFGERRLRKRNFSLAELPAEDRHRRLVPSTPFLCRAWFYRLRSPFFAGAKLPPETLLPTAAGLPHRTRRAVSSSTEISSLRAG